MTGIALSSWGACGSGNSATGVNADLAGILRLNLFSVSGGGLLTVQTRSSLS